MKIITGVTGKPHITADQDAMWHRGIWKNNCIIKDGNNMAATIQSNNEIRVKDGICSIQGRFASIDTGTYDTLRIDNGLQGQKRIDLIVIVYEKNRDTGYESISLKVKKGTSTMGTPLVPSHTPGVIGTDVLVEVPFYEVNLNGLSIAEIKPLMQVVNSIDDFKDYITSVENWTATNIEQGKIIKYKSGRCEVYGQLTIATNFSVTRTTNIYSTEALTLNFPVIFKNKPTVTVTIDDIKNLGFIGYTAPTTSKSTYTIVNIGTNGAYTCKLHWRIVGEI